MNERRARLKATVERLSDGVAHLKQPGDMILVERGVERLLVFRCPDGCGDTVPVNLDPRAGPPWRLYRRRGRNTLFPSVWRLEGCRAHFILWNDRIYWSGADSFEEAASNELLASVRAALTRERFRPFVEIASELNEIPWAILVACKDLVRAGHAEEGRGDAKGQFRSRV